ncbi:hypothetical protein A5848_000946, partial [Enterococcus faecium]
MNGASFLFKISVIFFVSSPYSWIYQYIMLFLVLQVASKLLLFLPKVYQGLG